MRFFRHRAPFAVSALIALVLASCAVTEVDIETWKGTVRGPGRIVAVLSAPRYHDELRVRAGMALIEMERSDVDGVSELQTAIRNLPEADRTRIVDGMTPSLLQLMRGEGAAASATPVAADDPPSPIQIRAKDASFLLISYASPPFQQQLTDGVVGWFTVDFNGRNLSGNFSAEQVVRQLGAPACGQLVEAMSARIPQAALVQIALLISQLGDAPTKARAAERIVAIEREMEGAEFGTWLTERIRNQATASSRTLTDVQVQTAVELNREQFITLGAMPAMHQLADQPVVVTRLLEIAQIATPTPPTTVAALTDRRVKALQALEGHTPASATQSLLALGLNDATPTGVRDYAFDRVADSHDRTIIPQLWPLATQVNAENDHAIWRVRWRVGTLLLTLGGADVVTEWFTRLPVGEHIRYAREELHGYAERLAQIRPEPTATVRAQLASADWAHQVIALYYFDRAGVEADLPSIQALTTSTTPTHGDHWEEHATIGTIATDAVAAIRERAASASAAPTTDAATTPTAPAPTTPAAPPPTGAPPATP
jgi:hypothetical protein